MSYVTSASDWIGDNAAVLTALFALFVAAYQAYATRRHNRLSVRPHVVVFTNRNRENGQGHFQIQLRNSGLGPALIRCYSVYLDNEQVSLRDSSVVASTVSTIIGRPASQIGFYRLVKGDAVAKDQELNLLSVRFSCPTPADYEAVIRAFDRLSARIE